MKPEIKFLIDKQQSGGKLNNGEIHVLMLYALDLLEEFNMLTQASIAHNKN